MLASRCSFARAVAAFAAAVALLAFAAPTRAQEVQGEFAVFGPFAVQASQNRVAILAGPVDDGAAQAFSDLLAAFPTIDVVVLSNTGGSLVEAVVIAEMIRDHRLAALVRPGDSCGLPCSVLLMAGVGRTLRGTLVLEGNSDDPPFIRPLVEDRLIAYGAPPEFIAALHDAWEGRPRTIGPGDIAAIEVGSAEGLATIPPAPPVPEFTGTPQPFAPIGDQMATTEVVSVDAAGNLLSVQAVPVVWLVSPTEGLPGVRAALVIDQSKAIFVTFTVVPPGSEYSFIALVRSPGFATRQVSMMAWPIQPADPAPLFGIDTPGEGILLGFPSVLVQWTEPRLLSADAVLIELFQDDGTFVLFRLNFDELAGAALAAAFAEMRE